MPRSISFYIKHMSGNNDYYSLWRWNESKKAPEYVESIHCDTLLWIFGQEIAEDIEKLEEDFEYVKISGELEVDRDGSVKKEIQMETEER
jgi:hypothetical protein